MSKALSPTRDKRRKIFLLRGLILVAVGGLLVDAGGTAAGLPALTLLSVFALSNGLLPFAPFRLVSAARFELIVGALDLTLVALGIYLAGATAGALPISCLLMALVVALGNDRFHAVAGAAAVGALHAWLVLDVQSAPTDGHRLLLQTLFLSSVGLYYGYLTEGIHRRRRSEVAEELERRELTALLEILEAITSSLDLQEVTRAIVTKVAGIVPAVRCSMLHVHVDGAKERCYVLASHDNPDLNMLELDLDKYPEIRHAHRTREPLIIQDVLSDPLLAGVRDSFKGLDFQSLLVVPLTFGEDLLGTLCLKTAQAKRAFTAREISFCTAVAKASANCLRNAVLHRQVLEESARHRTTGEKLESILDHSPDLILTTDRQGLICEFNRGAERLLGYGKAEVLGRPFTVLQHPGDGPELASSILAAKELRNHSCRLQRKDGSSLDVEVNMSPLGDEREEPVGTVWMGRDVSDLKAAQLQLLQAEKLSTVGKVISGVAHELNNPLTGVVGFSQLLLARHGHSPFARDLEKISESALRCQKIVKSLLSFVRQNRPERKYLGLNGILDKTLDLKRYHFYVNNVEVVRELDERLPRTMLDFHQMQQVFLNLLNNAEHAMAAVPGRPGRLLVRTSLQNGMIRAEITDNGEGMSAETLERIFEPFFTTKEQGAGTGLGLSVSYGIVKEHGGRIHARSRQREGSSFTVELPICKEEETEDSVSEAHPATSAPPARAGRILLVDDEPVVQDLLIDILDGGGHKLDTAANGREACRKIGSQPYDLVITDLRMPHMSGMDLYRTILSMRPEMEHRVVFITGDLIDPEIVEFLATVKAPILPKPLDIARVREVVRDVLGPAAPPA